MPNKMAIAGGVRECNTAEPYLVIPSLRRFRVISCEEHVFRRAISDFLDLWTQASAAGMERHGPHPHWQATMAEGTLAWIYDRPETVVLHADHALSLSRHAQGATEAALLWQAAAVWRSPDASTTSGIPN